MTSQVHPESALPSDPDYGAQFDTTEQQYASLASRTQGSESSSAAGSEQDERACIDVRYEFEKWASDRGESAVYIGDGLYQSGAITDQAEAFAAGVAAARAGIAQRAASAPIGYISQSSLYEMPLSKGEVHGVCPAIMPRESDVTAPAVAVYTLTQQAAPEAPASDSEGEFEEPDHGETVLRVQEALGITRTGWVSPDVILHRIEVLQRPSASAQPVAAALVEPRTYMDWWTSIETDLRKSMLVWAHREPERLHALVKQAYEEGQYSVKVAAPAAPVAQDTMRLNAFIDWFLREGNRSEVHRDGHMVRTTRKHIIAFLDRTAPVAQATAPDPVVEANRQLLLDRSRVGVEKYGVTLAASGLTQRQLLRHALEETLDLANYIQAILSQPE